MSEVVKVAEKLQQVELDNDVPYENGGAEGPRQPLRRGKCKWFNVAKGWGFITPNDGGSDVFVHQSVIQMGGFRSLGDEEEVEFDCQKSDKGYEATVVTGVSGSECHGSHRRPMSKKRFRKIRCFNCGELSNHIAAKCSLDPQPKRCHNCKSEEHLIAECPDRRNGRPRRSENDTSDDSPKETETKLDEGPQTHGDEVEENPAA